MKRVYYHYQQWETYQNGMYSDIGDINNIYLVTKDLISNTHRFKNAMYRVVYEWPLVTEMNLTNTNQNRIAWLGQAACCIEIGSPEDVVRMAWRDSLKIFRNKADKCAHQIITEWIEKYETKNIQLYFYMGKERIRDRNTRRSRPKTRVNGTGSVLQTNLQGHFEERLGINFLGFSKRENKIL